MWCIRGCKFHLGLIATITSNEEFKERDNRFRSRRAARPFCSPLLPLCVARQYGRRGKRLWMRSSWSWPRIWGRRKPANCSPRARLSIPRLSPSTLWVLSLFILCCTFKTACTRTRNMLVVCSWCTQTGTTDVSQCAVICVSVHFFTVFIVLLFLKVSPLGWKTSPTWCNCYTQNWGERF